MRIFNAYFNDRIQIEKVEKNNGKILACLKSSPFYPDGKGGQLGDRGSIGPAHVLSVRENGDYIICELDREIQPGEYDVTIDERRRIDIAQQHTAQHILSAAFIEITHIKTVSFHMGDDYCTIDMETAFIEPDALNESEELANRIVQSCTEVEEIITDLEGSKNYSLRKPLSEKVKGDVRLIKIGQFDVSACSGFHTENTGEVGMIKIIDTEKVKGELTRLYFVAGMRSLRYFQKYNSVINELDKMLTTSADELQARIVKMQNQMKGQASTLSKISEEYAHCISTNLKNDGLVYVEGYNEVGNFLLKIMDLSNRIVVFFDGTRYLIASHKYDVRPMIKKLMEVYGGRGGGKAEFANYQLEKKIERSDFERICSEVYQI